MEFEINPCNSTNVDSNQSVIPVLNKELTYNDFFNNYMCRNVPCVITNVSNTWDAHSKWLSDEKLPNLPYLKDKYGDCEVSVYNCNEKYFNSHKIESCKFATFLEFWNAEEANFKYLKDWHLKNTFNEDNFYQVPLYFASDWLNEYLVDKNEDDYRFVYMGRAGTWTPFHADVFKSYSWSVNVCGKKRWVLLPPGAENQLRDSLGNLPYDVSDIYRGTTHFELTQGRNEAIFVPSGWHHQVWNLEDTISINHNWVNGCNIAQMWSAIEENLNCVKKEIEDCSDMENFLQHCQLVLKASFGMDFFKFFDFLEFIAIRRIQQLEDSSKRKLFHGHSMGLHHIFFDLRAVKIVVEKLMEHGDLIELLGAKPAILLETIIVYL